MAEVLCQEQVSIVIPVYNAAKCITETMFSIKSQTYKNWELILVDNGSEDNSRLLINEFIEDFYSSLEGEDTRKIKLISTNGKTGAADARNTGVREAKGRYIAFLDADDLWDPVKLEKQIEFMKEKDAAFSFTGYEFADEEGIGVRKIVHVPEKMTYRKAVSNTTIFTSTVMFDMDKLTKEQIEMPMVPSEDTATWWKVLKAGYVAFGLDIALTLYRRSSGTLSSNKFEAIWRIWNLYRNVEHFGIVKSSICFVGYAFRAVARRI